MLAPDPTPEVLRELARYHRRRLRDPLLPDRERPHHEAKVTEYLRLLQPYGYLATVLSHPLAWTSLARRQRSRSSNPNHSSL